MLLDEVNHVRSNMVQLWEDLLIRITFTVGQIDKANCLLQFNETDIVKSCLTFFSSFNSTRSWTAIS
jgi:hypothetical protein